MHWPIDKLLFVFKESSKIKPVANPLEDLSDDNNNKNIDKPSSPFKEVNLAEELRKPLQNENSPLSHRFETHEVIKKLSQSICILFTPPLSLCL